MTEPTRGLSEEELREIEAELDRGAGYGRTEPVDWEVYEPRMRALIAEVRRLRDAKVTVSRGEDGSLTLTNVGDVPITFGPDEHETVGWPGYGALRLSAATGWIEQQRPDGTWRPYWFVTPPTPSADQARES